MTAAFRLTDWSTLDAPLWAGLDPAARRELQAHLEPVSLPGGEVLFREGDPADALYMLVSGSLGISVRDGKGGERRIARSRPPETIGEMALISDAPRSATVVALRDSALLRLTRAAFEDLVERWPPAMLYLARLLADRLRHVTKGEAVAAVPTTFAVVPVTQGVSAQGFGHALLGEMRRRFGAGVDILDACPDGADEGWFHRFETGRTRILYVAPDPVGDWTERCVRLADHVLFLAKPGEPLVDMPRSLAGPGSGWQRRDLVLVQAADAARPLPAHPSVDALAVDLRLQSRQGHQADLERIARTICGQAMGLVLAGGGARGFAHLGVIKALREHGVPIDLVGGTSIGSIIAASCALDGDFEEMRAAIAESFVMDPPLSDYTLPLVALVRGRKVDRRLEAHFGDRRIEDLWLPFFCVSSNLTTGSAHVHRRGLLWRALRASIAIPGLLPPAMEPEGVLVDGAMMNNLPADVMASFQRGRVLGVDVAQDVAFRSAADGEGRAPWLRRLFGIAADAPDIVSILHRAATVSGDAQTALARAEAHLIIHPPLADVPLRAWKTFDAVVEIGYRHARAQIEAGALEAFRV
ncbi:MAG TPA: patatin-like phospholipase family protein [Microvirga sp.]|jgi:NTE family protein